MMMGKKGNQQLIDGVMVKAPLAQEAVGPNPTDRSKSGTKRSLLTDGRGVPLGVAVDGANRHDMKMVRATLEAQVGKRPKPTQKKPQNMCLDKGYDFVEVRDILAEFGYIPHIRTRGEETAAKKNLPGYRARRWVVERTHSWMNRFRRLLIRWEKKVENYLAMLELACAFIAFRAARVFG
jgi:transposase